MARELSTALRILASHRRYLSCKPWPVDGLAMVGADRPQSLVPDDDQTRGAEKPGCAAALQRSSSWL
jgi:hypothetical protein